MLVAIKTYDKDKNKRISRDEIVTRLQKYVNSRVALTQLVAVVRLNNRPLEGAMVRFVPEPYFDSSIKPATGKTGRSGGAMMDVDDRDSPSNQVGLVGVQFGTYRVKSPHRH